MIESENILIIREDKAFYNNVEFQGEWKKNHYDNSFMRPSVTASYYMRAELIVLIRNNGSVQVIKDRYSRSTDEIMDILGLEHTAKKETEFDNRTILLIQ